MEAAVGASVEIGVGTGARRREARQRAAAPGGGLALRLLGPLEVARAGAALPLPRSRKVRALLAYLAMAPRPASRSHLCELLWDLPTDPRGELRWCLSKLRSVLDEPGRPRVLTDGDGVALDLADDSVDALEATRDLHRLEGLPAPRLRALAERFRAGDFLEGLDLPRSPAFAGWLVAERRRFRAAEAAVLEHWVRALPSDGDAALAALERWLAVAPFDRRAHVRLLEALAARGRLREGDEHLAAAARQHEAEGQDWGPLAIAWRAAKARHASSGATASPVAVAATPATAQDPAPGPRRASLAVMPFVDRTPGAPPRGGLGEGMARDVITRLSKLRSMFVIAEGTMLALAERQVASEDAGRRLDVDYVVSGTLQHGPNARLVVNVQLTETRAFQVVWADEFAERLDDALEVLDRIGDRIVAATANQIELAERNRAILKNPHSLNAWEAHHRGLWHMMRFAREDNEQARRFFETAVRLDPTFARPRAGLSFTHFQDAFLGWRDPAEAIELAYAAAADGLMADEQDPASHWALGRALWLKDRQDEALDALRSAIELSPNFALGHYTLGFVLAQSGDPQAAIAACDRARALSPMDPLLFAMLAARALGLLRLGRCQEAADWAVRAGARPNAHVHIRAIAVICLALAGRTREAKETAEAIHRAQADYDLAAFGRAFRLGPEIDALVRRAWRLAGS